MDRTVDGTRPGPDGRQRCPWAVAGDAAMMAYHDEEWGRPVRDEAGLYERLVLESFQSGLSWATILRKREAFREAFAGFDVDAVAGFGEGEVLRLMDDARIVRNRRKIEAALTNARATVALRQREGLAALLWSHGPASDEAPPAPAAPEDVPATTPASVALAAALKRAGFAFLGPTTCYATLEAIGVVNDHLAGCVVREQVAAEQATPVLT